MYYTANKESHMTLIPSHSSSFNQCCPVEF